MIRVVQVGKKKERKSIAVVETLATGRNTNRKFLLMLDNGFDSNQLMLTREELQELNENIAQTIIMENNNE